MRTPCIHARQQDDLRRAGWEPAARGAAWEEGAHREEGGVAVVQLRKAPDEVGDGLGRVGAEAAAQRLLGAALQQDRAIAPQRGHGPYHVAHLLLLPLLHVALRSSSDHSSAAPARGSPFRLRASQVGCAEGAPAWLRP